MKDVHQVFKKDQIVFEKIGGLDYHHLLAFFLGQIFTTWPILFLKIKIKIRCGSSQGFYNFVKKCHQEVTKSFFLLNFAKNIGRFLNFSSMI